MDSESHTAVLSWIQTAQTLMEESNKLLDNATKTALSQERKRFYPFLIPIKYKIDDLAQEFEESSAALQTDESYWCTRIGGIVRLLLFSGLSPHEICKYVRRVPQQLMRLFADILLEESCRLMNHSDVELSAVLGLVEHIPQLDGCRLSTKKHHEEWERVACEVVVAPWCW